jgi:hypothetical protein
VFSASPHKAELGAKKYQASRANLEKEEEQQVWDPPEIATCELTGGSVTVVVSC